MLSYRNYRDLVKPPTICNKKTAQSFYKEYLQEEKKKMDYITLTDGTAITLNGWQMYAPQNANCPPEKTVEKETAMTYEQNTRDYLLRRLDTVHYALARKLPGQFNLYVNNTPKTYKELIDAIKGGKYKLDEKRIARLEDCDDDDHCYSDGAFDGIIWDGPQPDTIGYKAAVKALDAAAVDAKDIIMTSDPKEGAAALKALGAWTPTGAAN